MTNPNEKAHRKAMMRNLINQCFEDAQAQGFEGEFEDWTMTAADQDWIESELPFEPTLEDWQRAGIKGKL